MKTARFYVPTGILFFILGLLLAWPPPSPKLRNDGQDGPLKSFEWWYAQRSLPYDFIPTGAFQKAADYLKTRITKERHAMADGTASEGWSSLGPANIGGRMLALAIDPSDPSVIWAGAASGGLWKSISGGTGPSAWSYVPTGFSVLSVSAIAMDGQNPSVIYIGTGEISLYHRPLVGTPGARASYGMGILKSTDAGASWQQTGLTWTFPEITAVQKIVINPLNTRVIYAATSEGTFKSTDAGLSWTKVHPVLMAMDLVMNPADTGRLYVSCGSLNSSPEPGIYMTQNSGTTWTKLGGGLPGSNFGRTALTVSASNPSVLYAGVSDASSGGTLGVYKSTDGGTSWTCVSTVNYTRDQGWYDNVIAVHPTHPDSVYCGGIDIYKSINGGANLNMISGYSVHVDQHAIAFHPANPDIIYFGCDGGVYKTTDGGVSFINCNSGLVTTQFYPGFAGFNEDSTVALGGLQDNGTLLYSGSDYWTPVIGADGGWCAIDPADKNVMYGEYQYLQLFKSVDGGSYFFNINNNLPSSSSNANFIAPFVISPSAGNVLYAGLKTVYKTTNGGVSWSPTNGGNNLNGTNVACIGVSRTSPDTLLAATGTGSLGSSPVFQVFSSTNGGQTWVNVTDSLPNRYPTDIEFDPSTSACAYITYSGYGTPHLFRTTNLGKDWTDITGTLPDIPHQTVALDPEEPQNIYTGTDLGVFHSSDGGSTWEDFNSGMPPAMVLDLAVSLSNGSLRAATFGNGIYQRKLVRQPYLTLAIPKGGEIWVAGQTETISWSEKYLGLLKLEYSSDNGTAWNLIADSVPAISYSYDWKIPMGSSSQARIRISNSSTGQPADSSHSVFSIMIKADIFSGWNLLSLALLVPDGRKTVLYPSAVSDAYIYRGSYLVADTLTNGSGYWLKFDRPQLFTISGDSSLTDTVTVRPGWNIIGSISADIPTGGITEIPSGTVTSGYFGFQNGYKPADTIRHGYGYWVKCGSDGKLVLAASHVKFNRGDKTALQLWKFNSLRFTDSEGFTQELFFTSGSLGAQACEMPPGGPEGTPDVRFSSDRMLETIPGQIHSAADFRILMKYLHFPVRIYWKLTETEKNYALLDGDGHSYPLSGEGSLFIKDEKSDLTLRAFKAGEKGRPASFSLFQNYPNPFNPCTVIKYSLSMRQYVSLAIFDVRGALLETLSEGLMEPGTYSVQWEAGNASSGIYFCKLMVSEQPPDARNKEASRNKSQVAVIKMLLVR